MTVDKMYDLFYDKMYVEQEKYRIWLMEQPKEVILNNAYEFAMREDLLMALENLALEASEVKALLEKGVTLDSLYKDYEKMETDHMQDMRYTIENRAKNLLCEEIWR